MSTLNVPPIQQSTGNNFPHNVQTLCPAFAFRSSSRPIVTTLTIIGGKGGERMTKTKTYRALLRSPRSLSLGSQLHYSAPQFGERPATKKKRNRRTCIPQTAYDSSLPERTCDKVSIWKTTKDSGNKSQLQRWKKNDRLNSTLSSYTKGGTPSASPRPMHVPIWPK